jgi:hypothetical protein
LFLGFMDLIKRGVFLLRTELPRPLVVRPDERDCLINGKPKLAGIGEFACKVNEFRISTGVEEVGEFGCFHTRSINRFVDDGKCPGDASAVYP